MLKREFRQAKKHGFDLSDELLNCNDETKVFAPFLNVDPNACLYPALLNWAKGHGFSVFSLLRLIRIKLEHNSSQHFDMIPSVMDSKDQNIQTIDNMMIAYNLNTSTIESFKLFNLNEYNSLISFLKGISN